jgi:hypothetical protein
MPNGKLKLYKKNDNTILADLDIVGGVSIEDNLNDTPSNMKVKTITTNTFREEFEVNTIAFHEDTNSYWVIKSDSSTYLQNGEYEHEIELAEYFEWLNYRHLPNCAFRGNRYTLQELLNGVLLKAKLQTINSQSWVGGSLTDYTNARIQLNASGTFSNIGAFFIAIAIAFPIAKYPVGAVVRGATTGGFFYAKVNRTYNFGIEIPTFVDNISKQPFFSFENYTVASAIKTIGRAINAIPKLKVVSGKPTLFFISRSGNENLIVDTLDIRFPVAYEKNSNSADQFTTRTISNFSNVLSSELVVAPKIGGFSAFTPNTFKIERANARFNLPSKVSSVEYIVLLPRLRVVVLDGVTPLEQVFEGYYIDPVVIKQKIVDYTYNSSTPFNANPSLLTGIVMPSTDLLKISFNDVLGVHDGTPMKGYFTLKTKVDFDTTESTTDKAKMFWFERNQNYVNIASGFIGSDVFDNNYELVSNSGYSIVLNFDLDDLTLYRVGYSPIGDIKVSYDNDSDSQDEKYFNQSGQLLDSKTTSKLVISYTNESVIGTKIRQAKYTSFSSILPLGQIIRDNGELFIISGRSIDSFIANGNEYFDVIYTLSKNRIARSEIMVVDGDIVSYQVPEQQLVNRTQLYKDYIELSLTNGNKVTPYLPYTEFLKIDTTIAGANFDYLMFGRTTYANEKVEDTAEFMVAPSIYDLSKSKLIHCDFGDNNIIGYKLDKTVTGGVTTFNQTPINYVGVLNGITSGEAYNLETLFVNSSNVFALTDQYVNDNYTPTSPSDPDDDAYFYGLPFNQNPVLLSDYYDLAKSYDSSTITENLYEKDLYEIPVVEYQVQANDDFDVKGNVVVGNDLFTSYTKPSIIYNYVVSETRFTSENADSLFVASSPTPSTTVQRVIFTRPNDTTINLKLYASAGAPPPAGLNTVPLQNKHIGIFAVGSDSTRKFLFAINDYAITGTNSNNDINLYINNWKI